LEEFPVVSKIALLCGIGILIGAAAATPARAGDVGDYAEGSVIPVASPASDLTKLTEHGSWAVYSNRDGTVMIVDDFTDGAKLALVLNNEKACMVLGDPAWRLPAEQEYSIKISVDGDLYSATGKVSPDGRMLLIDDLTTTFVQALYRGNKGGNYSRRQPLESHPA
jgi:hypothetical protein